MALVEARAVADRDHHVLQAVPLADVVVDVAGADHAHAGRLGERDERLVARPVAVDVVVLQLDEDLIRPEPVEEPLERGRRLGGPPRLHQRGDAALAAAGQHDHPVGVTREVGEREHGVEAALLLRPGVSLAQAEGVAGEAAEVRVALAGLGQQGQVRAHLGALVELCAGLDHGQLEAADRPQPGLLGRARELHRPEHALMVRQRQRAVALRARGQHDLVDARGALQQRVVAVGVQLDVRSAVEDLGGDGLGEVARRPRARRVRFDLGLDARAPGLVLVPAPGVPRIGVPRIELAQPTRHGSPPPTALASY